MFQLGLPAMRHLVPLRFLAMVGHFLATLVFIFSRKDNIIVALKFDYTSDELNDADQTMIAASMLIVGCFVIEAFGFFAGFTMFSPALALLHTTCHVTGGILLSLIVIEKAHYNYVWFVFGFFSALPACCELGALSDTLCLRNMRW